MWKNYKVSIFILCIIILFYINNPSLISKIKPESSMEFNRYAIIIGSNNGGPGKEKLKYSHDDVDSVANVFSELGNIAKHNIILLKDPSKKNVHKGLQNIKKNIEKNKSGRLEFLFYYSGHSDEEGILLNTEKMYYREIKEQITRIPVDVRIVILDSCSSGVFTRYKSGKMVKSFLKINNPEIKGHAFITSSSANELSQESDKIGGSFFTHYFTSGLRGAADANSDALITLNEAYQYAYNETIALVEKQKLLAQHPNYAFNLQGKGELVMTDIRKSSTVLIIDKNLIGRFYIRNKNEKLVIELNKLKDQPVELGLSEGDHSIVLEKDGKYYINETTLKEGVHVRLMEVNFKRIDKPPTFQSRSYFLSDNRLGLSFTNHVGKGISFQTRLSKTFYTKITAGYFNNKIGISPVPSLYDSVLLLGINLQANIYEFKLSRTDWRIYGLVAWDYFSYKEKLLPEDYYEQGKKTGDGLINPELDKSYPKKIRRFGDIVSAGFGIELSIFEKISVNVDLGLGLTRFENPQNQAAHYYDSGPKIETLVVGVFGIKYIF
jgi:hypothetical protein